MDQPGPQIPQPIILSQQETASAVEKVSKRGFFSTLGLLFSGWLLGNLILVALLSVVAAVAVGATGLVRVPLLTTALFGKTLVQAEVLDKNSLESAHEKIASISALRRGQSLPSLTFSEKELNALLAERFQTDPVFPVVEPKLILNNNNFSFSGILYQTGAPILVQGRISVANLVGKIEITAAKFGKLSLPEFISGNILDNYLTRVGLSLSGSQFPAQKISIDDGSVILEEVSNPQE